MKVYTIRSGDSLFNIARKFYGNGEKYRKLASYNGLGNPNDLRVGMKLRLPDETELEDPTSGLKVWHNYGGGKVWWRLTKSGIEVKGKGLIESSKYTKRAGEIWQKYQEAISTASKKYSVPISVIIATISTESSGDAKAYRHEAAFYRRYIKNKIQWKNNPYHNSPRRISSSYGLMQIMYTTAYSVGFRGEPEDLYDSMVSVDAGAAYIASAFQVKQHGWDPPKIGCAYNAGSVRPTAKNLWGMHYHPGHLDRWIPAYNGALKILEGSEVEIAPSKPVEPKPDDPAVTVRFLFSANDDAKWKPALIDLFKHEEWGLDDPVSYTARSATATENGYSYDLPNIAKGSYDMVFSDARSGSVFDDRADVPAQRNPTIVDLTSEERGSRALGAERSTLRFVFPASSPDSWKPVFIDLFKLDEDELIEPISIKVATPPPEVDVPYVHEIPDVELGRYDIECTDVESLLILNEIPDYEISQPVITFEVNAAGIRPSGVEEFSSSSSGVRSAPRWEKIKAFLKKWW
ncbi:MAG: transglycosylase SLT domain-containing protein [bacterium]|nr:transglycosylase SLT domain-containing protein [bacterium]